MEITITQTSYDKVQLSDKNIKEVTLNKLRSMLEWNYIEYDSGVAWICKDGPSYHGSVGTDYIRKATPLEISIYETIKAVHDEKL